MKRAVITGGSGGVGLALIRKLINENVEMLVFQRKGTERCFRIPKHKLITVEYCSLEELKNYNLKNANYNVFFHLGWANTQKDMRDNLVEQNKNINYSCDAVELAHRLGCHTFIGAGSQAEYGRHNEILKEDTVCRPETAYGVAKLCACYETKILCERYGINHIWARILSGYGIYDNEKSMLISTILNSSEDKMLPFTKGEQIWDFVYLDDIANALFLMAKKGHAGRIYPISSGKPRQLKEYIEILCEKLGKLEYMDLGKIPYSGREVMHLEADSTRLRKDTGWEPMIDFEEGIERVIDFYQGR